MEHLYFHSSNFDCTRFMREDPDFEGCYMYDPFSVEKMLPTEYGRIVTRKNTYHLLLGTMEQKGCPWCGSEGVIQSRNDFAMIGYALYWVQCHKCGARGPAMSVIDEVRFDEKAMEEFHKLLIHRFHYRRTWDSDFVNPYRNV
jgi:hypothetical protein